jgi:hypothetical protein
MPALESGSWIRFRSQDGQREGGSGADHNRVEWGHPGRRTDGIEIRTKEATTGMHPQIHIIYQMP